MLASVVAALPSSVPILGGLCPEVILGYSTGHVGTTSLSNETTYADGSEKRSSVAFFFEEARMQFNVATEAEDRGSGVYS